MDKESADAAAEKAAAIRVKVGYPVSPDTLDPRSLANYYARVKINEDTFFENMLSARVADEIRRWFNLGKQRDLESWEMYPSMVNAYFNPPANEVSGFCDVLVARLKLFAIDRFPCRYPPAAFLLAGLVSGF